MKRSAWPIILLACALGGAAFFGFLRLFQLRFQAGDIYPPYSSLRADPLGSKVLFDALEQMPGFHVSRNYTPLEKSVNADGKTFIYAGEDVDDQLPEYDVENLESLPKNGARLVVTLYPAGVHEYDFRASTGKKPKIIKSSTPKPKANDTNKAKGEPSPESETEEIKYLSFEQVGKRWGLSFSYQKGNGGTDSMKASAMLPTLERSLTWHSTIIFPNPPKPWRVLYRREGAPVLLDRPFGRGSIVVAADSYFMSNEAMKSERSPRLLATLIGSNHQVIFDETHFGVIEEAGVSTLIRKYNLGLLMASIGVLAILFIWQNSSPFLPPRVEQTSSDEIILGKDSTAGFTSLLRRSIAPSQIIGLCLDQWKKSLADSPARIRAKAGKVEAIAVEEGRGAREPIATYNAINQLLAEKK